MTSNFPVPSEDLRFNVSNSRDLEEFLKVGKRCALDLEAGLSALGVDFFACGKILDWGCGCGRTTRWLADRAAPGQLEGCDVDIGAINWCKSNLPGVEFKENQASPPLPYADQEFGLIFGVSVFTHLNDNFQQTWLGELKRLLKPNGYLLLSVMGENIANTLPPDLKEKFHAQGFLFIHSPVWEGIHAEWYADAFQSEKYVRERFSAHFNVLSYKSAGMNGHQDLVVMQKS